MHRQALHFHLGLDLSGHRCVRLRGAAEIRRCRARRALKPKIVLSPCGAAREVWRNGLHRKSWLILLAQSRGDRRCFLMTLKRPPLVCPTPPF